MIGARLTSGDALPADEGCSVTPAFGRAHLAVCYESRATAADPTQRTEVYDSTIRFSGIRLIFIEFRFTEAGIFHNGKSSFSA